MSRKARKQRTQRQAAKRDARALARPNARVVHWRGSVAKQTFTMCGLPARPGGSVEMRDLRYVTCEPCRHARRVEKLLRMNKPGGLLSLPNTVDMQTQARYLSEQHKSLATEMQDFLAWVLKEQNGGS